SLAELQGADVIVACDGVASWVRDALAAELSPHVDVRPNKFVWLGCTVPYRAFTFQFKSTPHGLFRVHAYPYHQDGSPFIVELRGGRASGGALAAYEARRRPEVEALQAAAQASLEWFEGTERYRKMAPIQFAYSLMTRSLRVSHASVGRRDPHLARGVEQLLAAAAGITPTPEPPPLPTALPIVLGDRRARS